MQSDKFNKCKLCDNSLVLLYNNIYDDRFAYPQTFDIMHCKSCDFAQTSPALSEEEIPDLYEKYYPHSKTSSRTVKSSFKNLDVKQIYKQKIKEGFPLDLIKKGDKLLDIGVGACYFLYAMKLLGFKSYGIDPDPSSKKMGQELGLEVEAAFIEDNPFPDKDFDVITANQVIEHTPDPRAFLAAAHERLSTDGLMVLSFPNLNSFHRRVFGKFWINWHVPYHINFFTKKSISALARQLNLEIMDYKTLTPSIWSRMQIRCLWKYPKKGEVNPIWLVQQSNNENLEGSSKQRRPFKALLKKLMWATISLICLPFDYLADKLGRGDSISVVLRKRS